MTKYKKYPTKRKDMKTVNRSPSQGGYNTKAQRKLYRKLGKVGNKFSKPNYTRMKCFNCKKIRKWQLKYNYNTGKIHYRCLTCGKNFISNII